MTAASGFTLLSSALFGAALVFSLVACQPAERSAAVKRIEAKWEARQLLFIGDNRTGNVRVFHLRGAPSLIAELRAPGRSEVRDIALDPAAGRIWVLGAGAVYLHDARTFSLVRRIPGVGAGSERLALAAGGHLLLVAADGSLATSINPLSLTASLPRERLARAER